MAVDFAVLDSLSQDSVGEIVQSWDAFCSSTEAVLNGAGDVSRNSSDLISIVRTLCKHGLQSLIEQHSLRSVEEVFEKNAAARFWGHFEPYRNFTASGINKDSVQKDEMQAVLSKALEEISSEKRKQEKCLWMLITALQSESGIKSQKVPLFEKHQLRVASVLMTSLPRQFPKILHWYFKERLEELSTFMEEDYEDDNDPTFGDVMDADGTGKPASRNVDMDVDGGHRIRRFSENNKLVKNIGIVVRDLRSIGLTSLAEDAYAYKCSAVQAVPLQFLRALLGLPW